MKNRPTSSGDPAPDAGSAPPSTGGTADAKARAPRKPSVAAARRAEKAAMHAQTTEAVAPTHDPRAAKASYSPEPVMTTIATPAAAALRKDPARADNWKKLPLEQLTDADILAMPDEEYMNEVQLAYFRRKLLALKQDILANAGETTEHLREDTVVVPDPADRATIEEEHALELRTRDRERKLLKKIEQSLARIDSGEYGYCEETGEPIGVGRLLARPTASLSIEAQQRRELKQKLFGD
ncbi:RNA polymerase-binding transcription factor DksA [Tepidimonas thermarum]|uniref:RNA polymerase-binding transcription factor DksA n=1 Tax=Tepidimonas thermarum TaxID=335431 RepID=A0A554X882_9BURK|nr:RNA polymerase-binding protein DksA [Tepidimonas thermarum]TSE32035.1 RNA polymerase-binding transcription factor DksA [Tepidimonas thermarum]